MGKLEQVKKHINVNIYKIGHCILLLIGLYFSFRNIPGALLFAILQAAIFILQEFVTKDSLFLPKRFFITKRPWILLLILILLGYTPSILDDRLRIDIIQIVVFSIIAPLLTYLFYKYIINLQKKYDILNKIEHKELFSISMFVLSLSYMCAMFHAVYYSNSSILDTSNRFYNIAAWVNIFFVVICMYISINCYILTIHIYKYISTATDEFDFKDVFPGKAFYSNCLLLLACGISMFFMDYKLQISFEFGWITNFIAFFLLQYAIKFMPNITNIYLFKRVRRDHIIIITSILIALFGVIARYYEAIRIVENNIPRPESILLIVVFILISIIIVRYFIDEYASTFIEIVMRGKKYRRDDKVYDYKKMYYTLFNKLSDIIYELQIVQRKTEEMCSNCAMERQGDAEERGEDG